MKKLFIMCILLLCIVTMSGCQNKYADKMQLVEEYLNNELSIDCTVVDCDYSYYDKGITGGQRFYEFKCRDEDGEFTARYLGFADLTAETVSKLTVDGEG